MKTVHTSYLNEIKSVFNSEADNEQYYKVLKNSNSSKLYNVELAQPIVRKTKATVIWKSETNLDLIKLSELEESKRLEIGSIIENFFKLFEQRIQRFKNIPKDFTKKVMEIPDWNSILVNESEGYIVIVNWGFLNDKFDRREGLIKTIFPVPDQSILIHLQNEDKEPISGHSLNVVTTSENRKDLTDTNGYARFGTMIRGEEFEVYEVNENGEEHFLRKFVCDGSPEYLIEKKEYVEITVVVKSETEQGIQHKDFYVDTIELSNEYFNTKKLGRFTLKHPIAESDFIVKDSKKEIVLRESLPVKDTTFLIELNEEKEQSQPTENKIKENTQKHLKLVFLNNFNKPLKDLEVELNYDKKEAKETFTTNQQGEVVVNKLKGNQIDYSFKRYREIWENSIHVQTDNETHYIQTKPKFPWIWWLIISVLLVLLWCCFFGNCFCKNDTKTEKQATGQNEIKTEEQATDQNETEIRIVDCNEETKSGGYGVTKTQHNMGANPGKVIVQYEMQNIPDKLEVFYEGNVLTSTFEINGNENGFVGDALKSGGQGKLSFEYKPNKENFVTVRVTGTDENTAWGYIILCPK
ncbi:hypothetical protein CAP47_07115 [Psychroflexus sp. S27]|uniref:hypothetical protein n=1 Tax=Psychroflexus sp. S27 TaxID=1982757 RepID=UPI000C2A3850|nr:hypothetical protein [Psychroflexus sp. S27]PJX22789.1 hypothetical protein CAP47_07115 [Psychroflexus sp. S27]